MAGSPLILQHYDCLNLEHDFIIARENQPSHPTFWSHAIQVCELPKSVNQKTPLYKWNVSMPLKSYLLA
jgi:hypothetical protein